MIRRNRKLFKIMGFAIFLILFWLHHNMDVQAEEEMKNVLIINSYHQGFAWTREQTEGIMNQLQLEGSNYSFDVEYMDWKNYNSEENLEYLTDYYRYKYSTKKIDIIVTTDDAALQFALENREKLFSDAPVVFSGVNTEGVKSITNNYSRVTGVVEVVDPTQTLVIAKRINPSLKKIYLLNDNSESGKSTMSIIVNTVNEFDSNLEVTFWNDLPFEEIVQRSGKLEKDSIILIGTYFRDIDDRLMDHGYATKVISENSSVPVYHIYDFGLGYGVIGGSLLSGKMQGESAAKMAYRILNGTDPDKLPVAYTNSTRTVFDYNQLLRFDISTSALPKDSEIINKPFSFYETYRTLVLSVIAAFAVLIAFLSILIFYIRKINKLRV